MLKLFGGKETQVVRLHGDPKRPEPQEVRIDFPGGFIYVSRCDQESGPPQWYAHIGVFHPDHPDTYRTANMDDNGEPLPTGRIVDARVDCFDQDASETKILGTMLAEIVGSPNVDHLAVKIATK